MKKQFLRGVWLVGSGLAIVLFGGNFASADIYQYVDSEGVLHFTNRPTSTKYKVYLKESPHKPNPKFNSDDFDDIIEDASARYGVSFSLIKAIIRAESGFNPNAVSHKGAKGLMQIMPSNFKALDLDDPFDPVKNIMAGVRYLARLLDRFQGKVPLALAAYNAGPNKVEAHNLEIPPIPETKEYVKRVMKFFYAYN